MEQQQNQLSKILKALDNIILPQGGEDADPYVGRVLIILGRESAVNKLLPPEELAAQLESRGAATLDGDILFCTSHPVVTQGVLNIMRFESLRESHCQKCAEEKESKQ